MKYLAIISFAVMCVLFACTKDNLLPADEPLQNVSVSSRDGSVAMCHRNGQGGFKMIWVNANAVAAHLAHGDQLAEVDADDDGYYAISVCGSGDDCDDNNPEVNPGAMEVCWNSIDDNCDGYIAPCDCPEPCMCQFLCNHSCCQR